MPHLYLHIRPLAIILLMCLTSLQAMGQDAATPTTHDDSAATEAQGGISHLQAKLIKGDVNSDGYINMSDATAVINYILNKSTGTFVFDAADTDNNGLINMSDLTNIINYILRGVPSDPNNPTLPTGDPQGGDPGTGV